jgi:hypothetical protein
LARGALTRTSPPIPVGRRRGWNFKELSITNFEHVLLSLFFGKVSRSPETIQVTIAILHTPIEPFSCGNRTITAPQPNPCNARQNLMQDGQAQSEIGG